MPLYKTVTENVGTKKDPWYQRTLFEFMPRPKLNELVAELWDEGFYQEAGWHAKNHANNPWVLHSSEGRPERMFPGPDHRRKNLHTVIRGKECYYYVGL